MNFQKLKEKISALGEKRAQDVVLNGEDASLLPEVLKAARELQVASQYDKALFLLEAIHP